MLENFSEIYSGQILLEDKSEEFMPYVKFTLVDIYLRSGAFRVLPNFTLL